MNILFPTDFSEQSADAFEMALYLAEKTNAGILLLHVYSMPVITTSIEEGGFETMPDQLIRISEEAAAKRIAQFKEALMNRYNKGYGDRIPVTEILRMGFVAEEIVALEASEDVSFIAMPVVHTGGVERLLFGGTVASVLKKSKCPVITVPKDFAFRHIHRIGYATDLTFADNQVIDKLLFLADPDRTVFIRHPHQLVDPVVIAAQVITALQQLISRAISPTDSAVISIGKVIANGATNVIPDDVQMEGTLRTMDEKVRQLLHEKITGTIQGMAGAMGARADIQIKIGYPSLVNDIGLTHRSIANAKEYLGDANVFIAEPRMGAEDFAFYAQQVPACFYRLGTGNPEKGITSNIHTPTFDIDEEALITGMGFMAYNALMALG